MVGAEPGDPAVDEIGSALAELWLEQRGTALERVAILEDAVAALASASLGDDEREAARAAAHKLRGSAGTYGFHRASELAGELEDMLAAGPIEIERTPHVAGIVLGLRSELEGEPSTTTGSSADSRLLIVSDNAELGAALTAAATASGSRAASTGSHRTKRLRRSRRGPRR